MILMKYNTHIETQSPVTAQQGPHVLGDFRVWAGGRGLLSYFVVYMCVGRGAQSQHYMVMNRTIKFFLVLLSRKKSIFPYCLFDDNQALIRMCAIVCAQFLGSEESLNGL